MHKNPTPGSCPNCNHPFTFSTCVENGLEHQAPREGDLTVCIGCGIILEFDSNLGYKITTNDTLKQLASSYPDTWILLDKLRNAIWESKERKAQNE